MRFQKMHIPFHIKEINFCYFSNNQLYFFHFLLHSSRRHAQNLNEILILRQLFRYPVIVALSIPAHISLVMWCKSKSYTRDRIWLAVSTQKADCIFK